MLSAGSVYESGCVFRIINEFKDIGIKATEYVGKNGNVYIRLSGHAGVRAFLNATRYLADNPKILYMGVGTQGQNAVSAGATRFSIVYSLAYRVVELIFKDEYTLTDFFCECDDGYGKACGKYEAGGYGCRWIDDGHRFCRC